MDNLTNEQIGFVIAKVSEWIYLKGSPPASADVDHSCLLPRLLEGKLALPKPPPIVFSRPCYPLGEGEKVEVRLLTDGLLLYQHDFKWRNERLLTVEHIPSCEVYQISIEGHKHFLQKIPQEDKQ